MCPRLLLVYVVGSPVAGWVAGWLCVYAPSALAQSSTRSSPREMLNYFLRKTTHNMTCKMSPLVTESPLSLPLYCPLAACNWELLELTWEPDIGGGGILPIYRGGPQASWPGPLKRRAEEERCGRKRPAPRNVT